MGAAAVKKSGVELGATVSLEKRASLAVSTQTTQLRAIAGIAVATTIAAANPYFSSVFIQYLPVRKIEHPVNTWPLRRVPLKRRVRGPKNAPGRERIRAPAPVCR